ncbi:1-phosphatidylinositol-4,5-bisphosphate phosphodiesterase delta-4 [Wickerhamomyces ciferrii]|uniref:Phosphoinositide phospholipase C n=1 Tax=Wickerhamomyces ciferrii (strain ATCC 14091 / BCRC 22168 / CBS 111 / JCM 3599 / NBRC 0793 / NRRL Y-1031 F-60-10) TaxID=1206466 RepID=K0KL98_WICCF|nr:1-phosphatidylinositol-4,5-bisphosphate phosphodiesterase delta-4 [Wickerhamomyces ciferrii]CCH46025.1 1-phosphatidylinositol-4,5-bisphosphate phosphodiesterase delta-4 [Wickerhamomyces ciferrii]
MSQLKTSTPPPPNSAIDIKSNGSEEYESVFSSQLERSSSSSLTNHYSRLRSNSLSVPNEKPTDLNPAPNKLSNSLSPVISPMKKVLNNEGLKNLIKKTNIKLGFSEEPKHELTDGPLTKTFEDMTTDSRMASDEDLNMDVLHLSDSNGEIVLESPEIPEVLVKGLPLLKITHKKKVQRIFKVDLDTAMVVWNNKTTSRMLLDNIKQIKVMDDAKNYREEYKVSKEFTNRWATVIYTDNSTNKLKALHVLSLTSKDLEIFVGTLKKLVSRRRELMKHLSIPGENFANIHWKNYVSKDTKEKHLLSFDDVLKLTKRLHINCDESHLFQIFRGNDTDRKGALNFEEFQSFVKCLKVRPEVLAIFNTATGGKEVMDLACFMKFIKEVQFQDDSLSYIEKLFNRFSGDDQYMRIDDFTNYITSSYLSPTKQEPEDYNRPFNEYFISSSHNTYLLGRQVGGQSSIEGYTKALQRGCRSIEVDIWDGDKGPVVSHGHTFTSSIPVGDVFETIRKYAFIITPFPLFISLEIHCKPEYQKIVVQLMHEKFGEVLITKPLMTNYFNLPSPMELKHKVLVKVKRSMREDSRTSGNSSSSFSSTACDETTSGDELHKNTKPIKKKKVHYKVIPELSALGVYALGYKFTNFSLPESKTINHIFSFSENSTNSMIKDSDKKYLIEKHNRKYLMRVYPSAIRYNSTNFNPINYWNLGTQMVATNWQTYDLGQQVNEAMFNVGSKTGYKLKPQGLRNTNQKFKLIKHVDQFLKFSIEILSGQLLPRPTELKPEESLSPYVVFEMIEPNLVSNLQITDFTTNEHFSSSTGSYATKAVISNGFNPIWNTKFEAKIKDLSGLNFFRLMVKTGDIPFAVYCFKLDNLNQGYRQIPLYDLRGEEYIFSTLFIHVSYESC